LFLPPPPKIIYLLSSLFNMQDRHISPSQAGPSCRQSHSLFSISFLTFCTPFGGIEFTCHTPLNHARILRVLGTRTGAFCINLSHLCYPYLHRSVQNHSSLSPLVTQIPLIAAWLIGGEGVALWWGVHFSAFVFKLSSSLDR
jgi:hypothetical protein